MAGSILFVELFDKRFLIELDEKKEKCPDRLHLFMDLLNCTLMKGVEDG
jgi:hypothetical protein